ncbi:hypothetical protein SAMN04489761_0528 [Tenacibaculum sp. MAR_2009_124]|uniref:hypothetical protein n=1 Tax=Tenacibaculum sp. MAR_2009_124 TaxID=1250059 RepID=UPI0008975048|nr:hypothetical protein [Tenacibaculum sp. MAR_2009_124]SEB40900.1 hypothetical protein SAMN04489761_0528 [Tenacibaculum sp. MAR_2009_124]
MLDRKNLNLGCVVYSLTTDGVKAEWLFSENNEIERGVGSAKRVTKLIKERKFEGEFDIVYIDSNGDKSPKLRLSISFKSGYYYVTWKHKELVTDIGIGIESDNKLLVSYKK